MKQFATLARVWLALAFILVGFSAMADGIYPNKPIRLLVGFPPGTATDTVARQIAQGLEKAKGWKIIVENKVGQAGSVAATDAARAAPDGYTLLLSANGPLATNPNLYASIRYDPRKDFTAIARVAVLPYVVVVRTDSKFKTIQELMKGGQTEKGRYNYASLGNGSTSHLIAATFATRTKGDYLHVPYKGSAETMMAVLSGEVDFLFDTSLATNGQIQAGKLRPLAVSTKEPVPSLKGIPTLDAVGLAEFDMAAWLGFVGPAGIPENIVKTLSTAIQQVVKSPELSQSLAAVGAVVSLNSPAEFQRMLTTEYVKWGQALQQAGIPKQ